MRRLSLLLFVVYLLMFYPACMRTATNSSSTTKNGSAATSPLMVAVKEGKPDVVKALLAGQDVDVNITDADGNTPLIEAARFGHDDVARA